MRESLARRAAGGVPSSARGERRLLPRRAARGVSSLGAGRRLARARATSRRGSERARRHHYPSKKRKFLPRLRSTAHEVEAEFLQEFPLTAARLHALERKAEVELSELERSAAAELQELAPRRPAPGEGAPLAGAGGRVEL